MNIRHSTQKKSAVLATLIFTSLISASTSMTFVNSASAKSLESVQNAVSLKQSSDNSLPVGVVTAVSREITRSYRVSQSQLRVVKFSQETWSDSCLGLGRSNEACLQSIVKGWRVAMTDGRQTWTYRTDATGRLVRQEAQGTSNSSNLPQAVSNLVLRTAAQRTGLNITELRIVKTEQLTVDGCLGLARPNEPCTRIAQRAWEVTVEARQQRLVYRANEDATQIRLNEAASNVTQTNLPQAVRNLVLRAAAQQTGLSISELRIVKTEQLTVDGCLGLARPNEPCTRIAQRAWEVTVEARQQRLVYRTNENATEVRFNEAASNGSNSNNLPQAVSTAVLRAAAIDLKVFASQLQITKTEQKTWENSCLGLQRPNERCMGTPTPGWRVTVSGRQQVKVYRTDSTGDRIRAEETSNSSDLPNSVKNAVLRDLANRTRFDISALRIVQAEPQEWPGSCLGLGGASEPCTANIVPGWRVTAEGGRQTFIYRTNESGSVVKLERRGLQGNNGNGTVPIPRSEIQPLGAGVVFRAISSGGFAGITTETTLMNDGRMMQRTSFRNQSPTQINQLPPQQVQQFQRLLEQNRFSEFDLVSFPAPSGAADFFTVTLTDQDGTTRYADIVQDGLPDALRSVINAWNQIATRR